jgi:hypothetical protein
MKRTVLYFVFFLVLGGAFGSLYYTQSHEKQTRVSANAVLEMAADASRLGLQKVEAMCEAQGDIVGFPCILNFVFPGFLCWPATTLSLNETQFG